MLEEDLGGGGGFRPPPWVKTDTDLWFVGWLRSGTGRRAEALPHVAVRVREKLDEDEPGDEREAETEATSIMAEREDVSA